MYDLIACGAVSFFYKQNFCYIQSNETAYYSDV